MYDVSLNLAVVTKTFFHVQFHSRSLSVLAIGLLFLLARPFEAPHAMASNQAAMGLSEWAQKELSTLLGFEETEEIADYVISMTDEDDQRGYIESIIGEEQVERFMKKFLKRTLLLMEPPPPIPPMGH